VGSKFQELDHLVSFIEKRLFVKRDPRDLKTSFNFGSADYSIHLKLSISVLYPSGYVFEISSLNIYGESFCIARVKNESVYSAFLELCNYTIGIGCVTIGTVIGMKEAEIAWIKSREFNIDSDD
jgi:hypothetical protein